MDIEQLFHGPNVGFLVDLYERYLADPNSVDAAARTLFAQWSPEQPGPARLETAGRTN